MKMRTLLKAAAIGGSVALAQYALRSRRTIDLAGKTVVVTGGSRGLGLVLARSLIDRGARVAICARDSTELDRARDELVAMGGDVFAAICDVTDRDDVLRFIASVEDDFGSIDVLINNAGIIQVGPLETMTEDDFDRALAVNLKGPMHAMMAVLPGMRHRKAGRIVNIASIGGKVAVPHLAAYSTSKFALVGLSEAMRAECTKDGIYVTTVCPGLMRTGSPRHAWFKGHVQAEYAWFSIGDSNSLTSISAEAASQSDHPRIQPRRCGARDLAASEAAHAASWDRAERGARSVWSDRARDARSVDEQLEARRRRQRCGVGVRTVAAHPQQRQSCESQQRELGERQSWE